MAKAVQRIVLRDFKGIDRRPGAPPNSFHELCNLVVKNGELKSAPGISQYFGDLISGDDSSVLSIAEYVFDPRFEDSHQSAVLAFSNTSIFECTPYTNSANIVEFTSFPAARARTRTTMHKMVHSSRYVTEYMPCLVMVDGVNKPLVYHQYSAGVSGAVGMVSSLVAASGNLSGTAYLDEAPIAKHCATYKERLFFGNTEGAENRIYWTDTDSALVWTCNVWPASYNMDIGYGESITNMLVFKGILYIFTNKSIWALSGEGQGGIWAVSKLADTGANEDCAVSIGDGIFFGNDDGAYVFVGGAVKKVSDPAAHAWREGATLDNVAFLSEYNYVFLTFKEGGDLSSKAGGHVMIFDAGNGFWYRWGPVDDSNTFIMRERDSAGGVFSAGLSLFLDSKTGCLGSRSFFVFSYNSSGSVYTELNVLGQARAEKPGNSAQFLIYPWVAITNPSDLGGDVVVRDVVLDAAAVKLSQANATSASAARVAVSVVGDGRGFAENLVYNLTSAEHFRAVSFKTATAFTSSCAIPAGSRVVVLSEGNPFPFVFGSFTVSSVVAATASGSAIDRVIPVAGATNRSEFLVIGSFMASGNGILVVTSASVGKLSALTVSCDSGAVFDRSTSKWGFSVCSEPIEFRKRSSFNEPCRTFQVMAGGLASAYGSSEPGYHDISIREINLGVQVLGRIKVTG